MFGPTAISFIAAPPPANTIHPRPKIVFSDLVSAQVRQRKRELEFPMSLDVLETFLRQRGYAQIDYAFLPENDVVSQADLRVGSRLLMTLGLREQKPYVVKEAQLWGINMMNYLQAPAFWSLLKLAGVPARSNQRDQSFPLIVMGGQVWPNPLPLSSFYDVMVIGDGEQALAQIAALLEVFPNDRDQLLSQIATLEGVYVPGHTDRPVKRATIDFSDPVYPAGGSYVLNGVGAVVLSRGCAYSCAFCNNSLAGGPYRIKPIAQVRAHIDRLKQAGAHTVIPIAASASSYVSDGQSVVDIIKYIQKLGMTVKSMSDRPERLTPEFLRLSTQKTGKVVIALESSPRIRQLVFQKSLREETIEQAISTCITADINRIQLYVILAVPAIRPGLVDFLPDGFNGEQLEDLQYLAELAMMIVDHMLRSGSKKADRKPLVVLDCMPFVPAIGTRLQKVAFPPYNDFIAQITTLKSMLKGPYQGLVEVSAAMDESTHMLQVFLERGDARSGDALHQTWRRSFGESLTLADIQDARLISGSGPADLFVDYLERHLPYEGLIEVNHGRTCRSTV